MLVVWQIGIVFIVSVYIYIYIYSELQGKIADKSLDNPLKKQKWCRPSRFPFSLSLVFVGP